MSVVHSIFRNFRGALSRSHEVLKRGMLIMLPIFALMAYLFSSELMLLAVALGTSVLVLLSSIGQPKKTLWKDPNTGLVDDKSLIRLLDRELLEEPSFQKTACIALAIDNFAELEAKWDKATCDQAINETAYRMNSILRSSDEMSRLSKTSFGILVTSVRAPETSAVLTMCERLEEATSAPIQIDDGMLHLTVSAGFCIDTRAPQRTGTSMLAAAKAALEEAKQNAPRAIRGFSHQTAKPVDTDFSNDVLEALREGQIIPWFQPQISTDTGEITGFEALARWDHPEKGILQPSSFVPALEEANRLEELGENMLNHALRALVAWDKAGVVVPSVGVNFATQELRNPSLVERIKWDVDRFELDPSRLTVEILETVISDHEDDIITRNIRALGSQGFRVDLDDFGTGHASLSNIRRFGVDRIKIDRSFVADVDSDPEQQRMVAAIIGLGERLGIETLAEGVENIGEQSILSQLGCDHLQGFAVARPMPFNKTIDWIHQHQITLGPVPTLTKRIG